VQTALTASEARYRLAIDATQLGTWSWDPGTNTATVDDRTRDLLGLTDAEVGSPGKIIATRVHRDDRERLLAGVRTAIEPSGDGRFQGEYRIRLPDGTERWALAFARVHFAGEGTGRHAERLIGTILDITSRKRTDARDRVLARLGADLLVAADDETSLQRLADAAVADLADWAIVDVIDPGGRTARRAAVAHADPDKLQILHEMSARYPPDPTRPTLGGAALATGQPQLYAEVDDAFVGSVARDAEQARLARLLGARSAIVVPLQTRDGPFGVVAFGSGRRTFTPEDLSVAEELGRRASLAVENARLVAAAGRARLDAEQAAMRTSRLQALSAALAAALTPNDVAVAAVREGVAAVGANAGVLALLTADGRSLEVVYSEGYEAQRVAHWRRFPIDAPAPLAEAVRTGEPVVIASGDDRDRRFPGLAGGVPIQYPASISVPLMAEGRSFGALGLSFRDHLDVRPEDRELLIAVARQCAQAVRRATLFDAEAVARASAEAAGRRLAFLAEASAALASLDYEATLRRVARLAVPTFADYVAIDILDEDGALQRVAYAHVDPAKDPLLRRMARHHPRAGEDTHPLRASMDAGEAVLVAEVTEDWVRGATRNPGYAEDALALGPRSLIIAPLSARGQTLGAMTFAVSESGRRYAASDLALATEVARRAATAVDNARLYRQSEAARRDAEAASRAKGQFLAVMSHELRTPLNAILGYSELVQLGIHGPVTDAQREAMSRILRSGQHLLSLVNNVLSLERAEAGAVETELAALAVADLFEDADTLSRVQAEAKGLMLTVDPPPDETLVLGEREKVGQVLANLLSNAVKFTPAGGRVTLACDVDERTVRLRVRDSGIGIPASALDRAFQPFVQLDSGLTRRAEGAGLGLAISRSLARLMGGELSAESTEGAGSTFTLTLVRAPSAPNP
jgi:PAS domain S-box-containing protein